MKILVFFILILVPLLGCSDFNCGDIFTLKSVKVVRDDDIDRLKKKAEKYEKGVADRIQSAEKAGNVYQMLGEKYLERKLWDLSIESFGKAIGYGRNTPGIHYSIAVAYANRAKELNNHSDVSKAEYHYRRALEIQPDYLEARYGLGVFLFYIKKDKENGLKVMETVVRRNRNYYRARFALGRFHYEMNHPERALAIYEDLHTDLQGLPDSSDVRELQKSCKENIERLMTELSRKR